MTRKSWTGSVGSLVAAGMLVGAFSVGTTGATADTPLARTAQWAESPWYCEPKTYTGYGSTNRHERATGGGGGGRFYVVRLEARAVRCGNKTRVTFRPHIDQRAFPSDRYVEYSLASAGRNKKYRAACVRISGSRRCRFRETGPGILPGTGSKPVFQFRGKGVIRYVKMYHYAGQGSREFRLVSVPQTIATKLKYSRTLPGRRFDPYW